MSRLARAVLLTPAMKKIDNQKLAAVTGGGVGGLIATCVATGTLLAAPSAVRWYRELRAK